MDLLGFHTALDATRRHVTSAQPNAPVRPDPVAGGPKPLRRRAAQVLRRVADRLEPAQSVLHPAQRKSW